LSINHKKIVTFLGLELCHKWQKKIKHYFKFRPRLCSCWKNFVWLWWLWKLSRYLFLNLYLNKEVESNLFPSFHYHSLHYYKMWAQFTSPCSLDQWIHCFPTSPRSLQLVNSLKIQWNHLAYRDTFCCSSYPMKAFLWITLIVNPYLNFLLNNPTLGKVWWPL